MKASRAYPPVFVFIVAVCLWLPVTESRATLVVQIGQDFTGSTLFVDSSALPADGNGAVGPDHFVEFVNGRVSVYSKASGSRVQSMTDLAFWRSAGVTLPANLDVTDPRVVFDTGSQRWFASQVDYEASTSSELTNRFLVAVSASADPTGPWKGFGFVADPVTGNGADFPTLGVDADGVYLSGDMFDAAGHSLGSTLVAIPKNALLANPPSVAGRTSFGILSYATNGTVLQPAVTSGAISGGEVVLAMGDLGYDLQPHSTLVGFSIQNGAVPGGATLTRPETLSVPPYRIPPNPLQPDGSSNLDDGDARFSATVYRIGDILYSVHSTEVSNRAAVQWFRINATNLAVIQTGIIADTNLELFFPSIAANPSGTVVIACNGSSSNSFVSSYALIGETVNGVVTFGDLQLLKAGTASYQNTDSTGVSRWGDYSAASVDPTDPNRFWTIQMYPSSPSAWSTQITELITRQLALTIAHVSTNVLISWPSAATGFQLQFSPALSSVNTWSPVTQPPTTSNHQFTVSLPISGIQQFFRLSKP